MNKKGVDMMWASMATILIVGAFAILMIRANTTSVDDVKKFLTNQIDQLGSDYDRDGIQDIRDPSPCVADKDKFTATDNKVYYDYGPGGENGERCQLVNGKYEFYPDLDPSIQLEDKMDMANGQIKCVYPVDVCFAELKAHYEQLRADR